MFLIDVCFFIRVQAHVIFLYTLMRCMYELMSSAELLISTLFVLFPKIEAQTKSQVLMPFNCVDLQMLLDLICE
jgi:hypothetical protein